MAEAYAKHKLDDGVEEVTGFCEKAIVKVDSPVFLELQSFSSRSFLHGKRTSNVWLL